MTVEQRFAELRALTQRNPGLESVARQVISGLQGYNDVALMDLLSDEQRRDDLYKRLWDMIVEPPVRSGNPTTDANQMAWEGVVIDHILWLSADGARWRRRTEDLIPIPV